MVTNQAYLFLIFIINGIIIGLLFDFFRILRKSFKTKDIITYIQDVLFWILTGFIILYSTFTFNNGEIRIFMFIAILIGIVFYMTLISTYIIKINVKFINLIKNILQKTLNILLTPFKWIYKTSRNILYKPFEFIKNKLSNILKLLRIKKYNFITSFQKNIKSDKEKYNKTKNPVKN